MITFILLLLAAAAGSAVSQILRLPTIPFMMLSGAALTGLGKLLSHPFQEDILSDSIVLGATFLVFAAGLRLNPRIMGNNAAVTGKVAVAQFLALGSLGYILSVSLGYERTTALYLSVALAASSTLVSVSLLTQRKQIFAPFGRLTTGVLLLQDLIVIFLISILPHLKDGPLAVGLALLKIGVLISLTAILMYRVSAPLITRWATNDEVRLLCVLAVLFSFMGLAGLLNLPVIAGAFLGGLALSTFPAEALIRSQLKSLEDFFSAAFFTALGANFASIPRQIVPHALLFALLVIVLTPLVVGWVGVRCGYSGRASLESGLLLSQTSEFSLLAALAGMNEGVLAPDVFALVALITLLTMTVTPFLSTDAMTWRILRLYRKKLDRDCPMELQNHIVLVGAGKSGRKLLKELSRQGHTTIIIDTDPAVVAELEEEKIIAVRADGADPRALRQVCANQARAVLSTLPRLNENVRLLGELTCPLVVVRHDDPSTANLIRELGGLPVSYVDSAAEELLAWLEKLRLGKRRMIGSKN